MPEPGQDSSILTHKSPRLPLDRITGGIGITDTNHSQVHAGHAYHHSQRLNISNGASLVHTLDIPVGVYVHFQNFEVVLGQQYTVTMTEGDTPTTGTEDVPVQRNRNKTMASDVVLHNAPVTANTQVLVDVEVPGNQTKTIGIKSTGIEWVLAPGKSYTFTVTNQAGSAAVGYLAIDWYEEGAG